MSDACCEASAQRASAPAARHRGMLWAVLAINCGLFVVAVVAGLRAGSSALLGDSLDRLGDALVGIALAALWLRTSLRVLGEAWIAGRTPRAAARHASPGG